MPHHHGHDARPVSHHGQEPEQGAWVPAEMASEPTERVTHAESDPSSIGQRGPILHTPADRQGSYGSTLWRLFSDLLVHFVTRLAKDPA